MTYTDPKYPGVTFTLIATQDDIPVEGNAIASGDDKVDRAYEAEIMERLNNGDEWAWASVEVRATVEFEGRTFTGKDFLGGCSYENEADFAVEDGYFPDMKWQAYADLRAVLYEAIGRGEMASRALMSVPEKVLG